jgi:hypothetical protein
VLCHEREQLGANARHIGGEENRVGLASLIESDACAGQRSLMRDLVTHEACSAGIFRERRLGGIRRDDDHNLVTRIEQCAKGQMEERRTIDRLE